MGGSIVILRAPPIAADPYDVLQSEIWKTCKTSRKADQYTSAAAVISSLKLTYRIKQLRYCRSPQGRQHRICFIRQVDFKDEIIAAAFGRPARQVGKQTSTPADQHCSACSVWSVWFNCSLYGLSVLSVWSVCFAALSNLSNVSGIFGPNWYEKSTKTRAGK